MPLTQEQFQKARSAGYSTEQIIGFEKKRESTPVDRSKFETPEYQGGANSPAKDSMATQGLGYLKEHPFKSVMQGLPETVTGKTMEQRAIENVNSPDFMQSETAPFDRNIPRAREAAENRIIGGQVADMASSPANYLAGPVLKAAGMAVSPITTPIGNAIKNVVKYAKPQNQVKLAEEVQNGLMSQKRAVIDNYGKEYESIVGKSQNKVDLTPAVKNFVDEAQSLMQNSEFSQQVAAKNPQAMRIFDMTDKISKAQGLESISAKEADSLTKYIRSLPSIKSKLNQASAKGWHTVQWSNEDRMLLGLADDIKGSVIQAHPELGSLNKEYGQFMSAYKNVAPDFKIGTTINKIKNYGEYDPQKQQLLEGILPKQTADKIKDFNNADKTSKFLKNIGLYGLSAAGLGAAGKIGIEAFGQK